MMQWGRSAEGAPALDCLMLLALSKLRHLSEERTAKPGMKAGKLRHRVARTCVKVGKLPEFERLQWPLWIRRVLVRAQEGQ